MSEARVTTDHGKIKRWVEERGGHPARVEGTAVDGSSGVLLIDYGDSAQAIERITWDEFFQGFEENKLAFFYPDDCEENRSAKLVARDSVENKAQAAS